MTDDTRRLVAELAVRGRLVEPRDDEAPCPLPTGAGRDVAPPFALPGGWRWARLGELARLRIGKTPSTRAPEMWTESDDGVSWATIADLTHALAPERDGVVRTTRRRVSPLAAKTVFRDQLAPAGTLLLSFKLTLGQVAVLGVDAFHNEGIVSVSLADPALQPYLRLVLPVLTRLALPRAALKGATLNRAALEAMLVPLPPLAEQVRVVRRAGELLALEDELARSRQQTRDLGARLTRAAFAHGELLATSLATLVDRAAKVRPCEDAIVRLALAGRLGSGTSGASGWRSLRLDEIGRWAGGGGFPREEQGHEDRPILFCKVSDMSLPENSRHVWRTVHTVDEPTARRLGAKVHPAGTVVFPKTGGAIATNRRRILGRPAALDNNCLGLTPDESCSPEFLHLLLRAIDMTDYQRGGPVPALNQSRLGAIVVQLPPRDEQATIVAQVDRLLALTAQLETELTGLELLEARIARAQRRELLRP